MFAFMWRKSTRSSNQGNCIEVGGQGVLYVRDTKLGEDSPVLALSPATWQRFVDSVKSRARA